MGKALAAIFALAACGHVEDDRPAAPDAAEDTTPDACVGETDAELCAPKGCEAIAATDRCGIARTVDCGACSGGNVCAANTCQPAACASLEFPTVTKILALSAINAADVLDGASESGDVLLWHTSGFMDCTVWALRVGDTIAGATTLIEARDVPALASIAELPPHTATISGDGLTIIAVDPAGTGFIASKRSAIGKRDFSALSPAGFEAVNGVRLVLQPQLSPDGLALYFTGYGGPATPQLSGNFESVRASTSVPFPPAVFMPPASQIGTVRGVSSDRMSLFVEEGDKVYVLSRTSLTQPFANPNAPAPPPSVVGHAIRPIGSCDRLVGTCLATAVCADADLCMFTK